MGQLISNDLLVAIQIYRTQPKCWFSKLAEDLSKTMDKHMVSRCLDTLFDWMIVYGEYGETFAGRGGRLLFIDENAEDKIKELNELERLHPQIL